MILLDGLLMQTRAQAHVHLKSQLSFPDYYGKNLDALYDLLCEYPVKAEIHLIHSEAMLAALGGYGDALTETIRQAVEENPKLRFTAQ